MTEWIKTSDRLPEKPGKAKYEYVDCLIYFKGEILLRPWNCEHLCWDDEAHDDFFLRPKSPFPLDAASSRPSPPRPEGGDGVSMTVASVEQADVARVMRAAEQVAPVRLQF